MPNNNRNNKYSNNDKTIKYRPERNRQGSTPRSGNRNTVNNTRTGGTTKRVQTQTRRPVGKKPTNQKGKANRKGNTSKTNGIYKNMYNNNIAIMCNRSRNSSSNVFRTIWRRL